MKQKRHAVDQIIVELLQARDHRFKRQADGELK